MSEENNINVDEHNGATNIITKDLKELKNIEEIENTEDQKDQKDNNKKSKTDRIDNQLKYINIYDTNHYISNVSVNTTSSENDIDSFLEKERKTNQNEPWNKLNKTDKLSKLKAFSQFFIESEEINTDYEDKLYKFLKMNLENKKIQKVKDLEYDKENGIISEIYGLKLLKEVGRFYLSKPGDQHVSTSKNLAPKKKKSIKNTLKNSPTNK
tara:strand:- start:16 stop:648 length:633 start_codon:yes stop_codon:yes gene_type:complete